MSQIRTVPVKNDRVYLRTTREQKDLLRRAADLRHQQTTEFVLKASLDAAEEVIAQEERIIMSERDFAHFVELIENPKPPTQQLQEAMAEYRRLKIAYPDNNL